MQYDKVILRKMNLYALRDIGREIGVKAPASLKKATLIDNILKVCSGEIEPCFSNKGRPAMKKSDVRIVEKNNPQKLAQFENKLDKALLELKNCIMQAYKEK